MRVNELTGVVSSNFSAQDLYDFGSPSKHPDAQGHAFFSFKIALIGLVDLIAVDFINHGAFTSVFTHLAND